MNKLLIDVTEDEFFIIVDVTIEGNTKEADAIIARLPRDHVAEIMMLMSAGVKLKQSEHAGEFLAKFLDEHSSIDGE